ncbi:unnamed protein product [Cuscuta campestris]|uniref:LOB domain-containing protein n=1 Tax=Cuscuta campestris TaxID=132261 RepID=A0A484MB42_9ASTE|nr:unnamed protein product [Cuscuta campestris]
MSGGVGGGGGPCGACKYLRRKCVSGCIFAPYFESDQLGTSHFAAVHKVFGASNAAKMLLAVPENRRLEAVVTICYEALARARDPVYGCVGHIFSLQQQVVNLQAELAYAQARLSALHHLPPAAERPPGGCVNLDPSFEMARTSVGMTLDVDPRMPLDHVPMPPADATGGMCGSGGGHPNNEDQEAAAAAAVASDLHMLLAWEFVSRHLPGARFRPSSQ